MKWLAVVGAIVAAGCGRPTPAPQAPVQYFTVDRATAGGVSGVVRFEGKRPAPKQISMEAEAGCEALHTTPAVEEIVSTAKDGALAGAFVYVKTGLEGKVFEPVKEAVVLEQKGCQFTPRVLALRAGQTLDVRNSDPVSHNVHPMPRNNRDWNQQQPPGAADLHRRFAYPEVMIPVKCNIHNWMRTYIAVLPHPYFAITAAGGAFHFDPLPPGKYTVAVWHEVTGEIVQAVDVKSGQQATADFVLRD
jgi:plastocyanin